MIFISTISEAFRINVIIVSPIPNPTTNLPLGKANLWNPISLLLGEITGEQKRGWGGGIWSCLYGQHTCMEMNLSEYFKCGA